MTRLEHPEVGACRLDGGATEGPGKPVERVALQLRPQTGSQELYTIMRLKAAEPTVTVTFEALVLVL